MISRMTKLRVDAAAAAVVDDDNNENEAKT